MKDAVYDLIGIGLGPFNLSLAALAEPIPSLKSLFFEKNKEFSWHSGLLLKQASLQVPFLADLVTLIDPTSRFSFLQYLHEKKRLYKFYFREDFHIYRKEYNHYCQWVSSKLSNLQFGKNVTKVEYANDQYILTVIDMTTKKKSFYYARHLALGIGTEPYVPFKMDDDVLYHTSNFLDYRNTLQDKKSICVVGSGQSAAEVILELLNEQEIVQRKLTWVTRSRGFFPMEYSKLGLEHFSPDYMRYFYHLPQSARHALISKQDMMYKGISFKTITDIFDKLYELTVADQPQPIMLLAHSELQSIKKIGNTDIGWQLDFKQWQTKQSFSITSDAVIFATGYRARKAKFLESMNDLLVQDSEQGYELCEDFSIKTQRNTPNKIFVQNNSLFSHGVGSPDLGLGCYRNGVILNNILEKPHYSLQPENNVFQHFGVPNYLKQEGL